jgi:hypothetical protein
MLFRSAGPVFVRARRNVKIFEGVQDGGCDRRGVTTLRRTSYKRKKEKAPIASIATGWILPKKNTAPVASPAPSNLFV